MNISQTSMPVNVKNYVLKGSNKVNLLILIVTIFNACLFWIYDAKVLFYYNCLNVFLIFLAWGMLKLKKRLAYALIVFGGIFCYMILAVIYLGWDYGFQQYCIGFIASMIFTDYYLANERKITVRTVCLVVFDVSLYLALRLWTYEHPYVYQIDNQFIKHTFFIVNTLLGYSFLIMFMLMYSNSVHRLENALREMANIDPLTGICNRRKMQQLLKMAFVETDNNKNVKVVAMLDVDHFKNINDTYGHDVGDEVLKGMVKILVEKQNKNDNFIVSRWGGEEFLVFYESQKCRDEIVKEFDELRNRISDMEIEDEGKNIRITVTIGLAFYKKGDTMQGIIKLADDNLYEGKNSGRNKVVV